MQKVFRVQIILYKGSKPLYTIERDLKAYEQSELTDIVSRYVQALEVSLDGFNFKVVDWFYQNVLA